MSVPARFTWPTVLGALLDRQDLDAGATGWVMDQIMSGAASAAQVAAFAVALRAKGATAAELTGLAESMLAHAVPVHLAERAVDIVGTGGDQAFTVNISTMSAVVTAAAGAPVIKHGNRAASSRCGSADVLEAAGVAISLGADAVAATVVELGIGFCYAPAFHPSLRYAATPRREIGIPTVFNFLGPLTNPGRPAASAIGCGDRVFAPLLAQVFATRGCDVIVFRGDDGLDEITTTTTTSAWVSDGERVRAEVIDPARFGIAPAHTGALTGGSPERNLQAMRQMLAGQPGAVRDAVLLNAAAGLAAYRGFSGVALEDALAGGLADAAAAVDSGAAAALLDRWAVRSQELATG